MEVAPAEPANRVDAQSVDDPPSARFTWTIENFSRLNTKKLYSEVFYVGGYKWRVLIFPKGNNVDHLSLYLDVADSAALPYGWSRSAQFSLSVIHQHHNKFTVRKDTQHQFNARESDSGFTSFMPLSELYNPSRGFLVNDTCVVEADVAVRRVVDYWQHDSKKETGYVGLKNQGATGYMNSLLQTLYHIPYFRKAVYHMPTTENDMPSGSIPLALQSLFYKLQYSDTSVATKELTKSFGWDASDSFMQHDVQELNRVLCEKLEDKMKGTIVEGTIQQLFEGHHMNYIECINVDYKSTRKESFYDLQLDVKGCRDVYASFDKYVEVEHLEGDTKYHAEQHGLQDVRKGVLLIDFPPVLQLQLKRFEYDFMRDTMVKINDRYEFPLQLDLDRENGKYLSPDADRSVRNLYTLHSVLVHSGGVHGGHYDAYIRPILSDQWFKFDDEWVTKEDLKRALEEQYGGEEELPQTNRGFNKSPFKFTKYSNAYMLVYIRESDKEKIICNVDEKDIAEHLRIRLKKEQEEKEQKRKEKAEAHLYTIIKVARDEDLLEQIGRDIYFDLVDHDKVRSFRIQKQMPFNLFKEEVAKEFCIPVQFQRFWLWARRQNHTYRPNCPLTPHEEAQFVGQLREVSNKANNAELKLFLEVELGRDLRPVPPPVKTKKMILLFFKLYDPLKEELRYVGRLVLKVSGKPLEILTKLNELAGFAPDEEIDLYEEIKFEPIVMCEHIDKNVSFHFSQLEDGDIICFQKSPQVESSEQCRYPDVPSFLEYVHNRQMRLKKEQEVKEQKRKEKAEAHLYSIIKVARDEDLLEQIGRDIYFDLVDHDKVRSFRIPKQMPFNLFKEEVAKEFGIPVQFQRFWLWAKRQNHTYRPKCPLTPQEEAQSVGQLRDVSSEANNAELKLFLENLRPVPPPVKTKKKILLFFKLYDPLKEELRYVGRLFLKGSGKPLEILTKLNELAGFAPDEEIDLYEEIKFEPNVMCEHIDKKVPFRSCQLEDGDIICFQKSPKVESSEQCRYPDVPSFLEYVHNRQVVRLRYLEKPKEDEFCLELSKLHNYDDIVERIARHLGLDDPSKIRLTSHNCYSQQPKPQPIKYRGAEHLSDMLVHYNQTSDILYYEVLDIPLPELQGLKTLKVAFHHSTKDEVVIHTIRLPKQSTVGDVINDLKTKVELSHPNAELRLLMDQVELSHPSAELRLPEVFYHKIYKIFPLNAKIENINDQYWTLHAEEITPTPKSSSLGYINGRTRQTASGTDTILPQCDTSGPPSASKSATEVINKTSVLPTTPIIEKVSTVNSQKTLSPELPRSPPLAFPLESSSFDDMDAYISKLVSVVETDATFGSTTKGLVAPSIPQSTIDEAKKIFIKMLSQDLSEIPDFAVHLTESISVLSECCGLTPAQLAELNNLKVEFPTLLKTYQTSNHSLKEAEEKMEEKQGTKKYLVEQVKISAFAFQTQRAIHKDLISKEAGLQQEVERLQAKLAKISEKKKGAEKEIKQLHRKMVNLEQSRSSVLEEISTLETEKKTAENSVSSVQQKWTELRHIFMEPKN